MKAWKYVKPEYAPGALRGVFSIGTPLDYAKLDDDQADELDSARRRTITALTITDSEDPAQAAAMGTARSMGIRLNGVRGDFTFKNFSITRRVHGHALCLCRDPGNPSFGEKTAIIEIADAHLLGTLLHLNNRVLNSHCSSGPVSYEDVDVEAQATNDDPPDPFIKGRRFQCENELRIFWPGRSAKPFLSAPFSPPEGMLTWINP